MSNPFFEGLTKREARKYFDDFLKTGEELIETNKAEAAKQGVILDFSLGSINDFFRWLYPNLNVIPVAEDPSIPMWIRSGQSYKESLFDLDTESLPYVMLASYYMGAAIVRTYPQLKWTVGTRRSSRNMPVVAGFKNGVELIPHVVAHSMFRGKLRTRELSQNFAETIDAWSSSVDLD